MCRISGILNLHSPINEAQIVNITNAMQRGGPDSNGIYVDKDYPVALGHRRLALIDLSPTGHQPILDTDEQTILVFNGEIYNFLDIKKTLLAKGYQFKSTSDTEVVLYAYKEWGTKCFALFNGMFALAILDKKNKQLILARDHAGIKPLYYSLTDNSLVFASEIRAFKAYDSNWPENEDWRQYFLLFGHLPEPITTVKNVQPLQKGTCLVVDIDTLETKVEVFNQFVPNYSINNVDEAVEKVKSTLNKAVERHLISDAPIGLFLSGGIDSSLLTLLAQPFLGNNLHTLSIVFDNEKFSEKYYQDIIIKQTGANHKSFLVTEELFTERLPDILEAMDQPSTDGINSYFICKYAKEYGLKAVLSGIGADELFGGYPSFNRTKKVNQLQNVPAFLWSMAATLPNDKLKKLGFLKLQNPLGPYLLSRGYFAPIQVAQLLDCTEKEVWQKLAMVAPPQSVNSYLPQELVSYMETNYYMQNQLLKDTDYMSMWHSLEVRVPFLDKELMNLVYSIHPSIRYSPTQIKHLLIQAFSDILPTEIWQRPKQGFTFPFENWMRNVQPNNPDQKSATLYEGLQNGKTHWSRYWAYVLAS